MNKSAVKGQEALNRGKFCVNKYERNCVLTTIWLDFVFPFIEWFIKFSIEWLIKSLL